VHLDAAGMRTLTTQQKNWSFLVAWLVQAKAAVFRAEKNYKLKNEKNL
jgi:hypothetical protein